MQRSCAKRRGQSARSWHCSQQLRAAPRGQLHVARSTKPAKVVCIGEALFDMLASDADKGKPKEEVQEWTGYPGGAPCNVACGMGQLNIPVAFISCLGDDSKGEELLQLMKDRGVDVTAVKQVSSPTRDVYVTRKLDGDRVFDSFGQDTNTYCDCFIDADSLPVDKIQAAEVLVMGTLGTAYPKTRAALHRAREVAKGAGTTIFVDVNWRPVFFDNPDAALECIMPIVQGADLVKITDDEVEWAFGIPAAHALEHPEEVLQKLPNARGVLVTAGGSGAAYCFRSLEGGADDVGHVPVYSVNVQDTTGAGDAFTCGFLSYLLAEKQEESMLKLLTTPKFTNEAVRFAAACGALTTLSPGAIAAQPLLEDIESLVAESG